MALIKFFEGRQSIPEVTHVYDRDNIEYIKNGDVNLKILGYSFKNQPIRAPENNVYNAFINAVDTQAMFGIESNTYSMFQNLTGGGDRSLAVLFPTFTGFATEFNVESENVMTVYIPPILEAGCFDIILTNGAGYTRISDVYGEFICTDPENTLTYYDPDERRVLNEPETLDIPELPDIDIGINKGINKKTEKKRFAGDTKCNI